jgi:pre-mRNA-splicing factor CDC5/CEF1
MLQYMPNFRGLHLSFVLCYPCQVRAEALWRQIEATFKEMGTLGTEFECFRALHSQEQLAAPRRIENLQDAVKEQNEKERMLQLRYENLLVEQENIKGFIRDHDTAISKATKEGNNTLGGSTEKVDVEMLDEMKSSGETRAVSEAVTAQENKVIEVSG